MGLSKKMIKPEHVCAVAKCKLERPRNNSTVVKDIMGIFTVSTKTSCLTLSKNFYILTKLLWN